MAINNPWTMVPVYGAGHMFGEWLFSWWDVDHYQWNPAWIQSMNEWAYQKLGMSGFSFWAFMVGGNVLGIGLAFLCYPMIQRVCAHMKQTGAQKVKRAVNKSKQIAKRVASKTKPVMRAIKKRVRRNEA